MEIKKKDTYCSKAENINNTEAARIESADGEANSEAAGTNMKKKVIIYFLGAVVIFCYLYSNMIFKGNKLSFTNVMYVMSPWNSGNIEVGGPILSDTVDAALVSIYSNYYLGEYGDYWNSNIGMGANLEIFDKLYPINLVYLLPIGAAILLKSVLEFLIAFLGMNLLLKKMKINQWVAAIFGVAYSFSSTIVMWHGWSHSDVAAFAPWLILCTLLIIEEQSLKNMLGLSIVTYLMIVAGMPTFAIYFLYVAGIYVVILGIRTYYGDAKAVIKCYMGFGASMVLALIGAAPYLYQLISTVGSNGYSDSRAVLSESTLNIGNLSYMLFPNASYTGELHPVEVTFFAGVISVVVLPLIVFRFKEKNKAHYFLGIFVLNGLFAYSHLMDFIYRLIPAINTSYKYRVITVLPLALVIIAAINVNDIIENKEEYQRIKYAVLIVVSFMAILLYAMFSKNAQALVAAGDSKLIIVRSIVVAAAAVGSIAWLMFGKNKSGNVAALVIMGVFMIWDSVGFASAKLPWIEGSASIIPEATDTIEYLQKNLENERFVGLGGWTLFPNTGVYYGINDIRVHNFVFTNKDMVTYCSKMSQHTVNTTPTRVAYSKIDNYNLLSYMGVKYIVNTNAEEAFSILGEGLSNTNPVCEIRDGVTIRQEFNYEGDNFSGLGMLFGLYQQSFGSGESLLVSLLDEKGNELENTMLCLEGQEDNTFIDVNFENEYGSGRYYIEIRGTETLLGRYVTIWMNNSGYKDWQLTVNGGETTGVLIFKLYGKADEYSLVNVGSDGLYTMEMNEYSQKVAAASEIIVCSDEDEVLKKMSDKYIDGAMFVTSDTSIQNAATGPLSDGEEVSLVTYNNDEIEINCTLKEDRYILINDYYDKNWVATVDGEESQIIRSNYLTRAVFVKAGENVTLKLEYKNTKIETLMLISRILMALIVIAFVCLCVLQSNKSVIRWRSPDKN